MDYQDQNATTIPTSEEKMLGLLAHLSIFFGGIILPIILWATQKDKSKFVRFHSLQAIFFHIAYVGLIVIFVMLVAVIMVISGVGLGMFNEGNMNSSSGLPVVMIIMMVAMYGGIFLIVFGGIGYAIYVAIKTYKGALIRIPVIGNIIYKKVYGQTP